MSGDVQVRFCERLGVRFPRATLPSMSVEGNWLQHPRARPHGWEIHGVLGVAQDVEPLVTLERQQEMLPVPLDIGAEPEDLLRDEHEEFLAAIAAGGTPQVSWAQAIGVQRILSGMYASAEAGTEVTV